MSEFRQRCKKIARRFLQTVVIVDDEAYIDVPAQSSGRLVTPTRRTSALGTSEKTEGEVERDQVSNQRLDAGTLVESFSKQGLICAVVAPRFDTDPSDIVAPSVKRTDIVILDWQLNGDNGKETMSILKSILEEDAGERLRLIAIYTGEREISKIGKTLVASLADSGWMFESDDEHHVVLSYQYCRIVIYSKSDLPRESDLSCRWLLEPDLPEALVGDFAVMVEGLLPSIALMSLAAIRENVHKVLDRFDAELDPALLTHRASLPVPDDSQQHIVNQLAGELHAIMDDAVAMDEPAGMDAIREWLHFSLGADKAIDLGGGKTASRDQTIALLEKGLDKTDDLSISKKKRKTIYRFLTRGFSSDENPDHVGDENPDHKLDLRLAWMFNFRTVFNAPPPVLQLGTVLRKSNDTGAPCFLCMRPKCDSVRLQEKTAFLLLPLVAPQSNSVQLVLRTDRDTYRRVSVCMETSKWSLMSFVPDKNRESVVAERSDSCFYFTDEYNVRFDWLGELKAEFAQRVAQYFAAGLSRVPINNSEWLRKEEHG